MQNTYNTGFIGHKNQLVLAKRHQSWRTQMKVEWSSLVFLSNKTYIYSFLTPGVIGSFFLVTPLGTTQHPLRAETQGSKFEGWQNLGTAMQCQRAVQRHAEGARKRKMGQTQLSSDSGLPQFEHLSEVRRSY